MSNKKNKTETKADKDKRIGLAMIPLVVREHLPFLQQKEKSMQKQEK